MSLDEANAFVAEHHRHHKPVRGCKFCLGVAHSEDGIWQVVGVAIVGRPVARMLQDGWTLEVTRTCVLDGARNANSMLYGACWRAARALGYLRPGTYNLPEESGASLRAVGWRRIGEAGAGSWSRGSRPQVDIHPFKRSSGGKWPLSMDAPRQFFRA